MSKCHLFRPPGTMSSIPKGWAIKVHTLLGSTSPSMNALMLTGNAIEINCTSWDY